MNAHTEPRLFERETFKDAQRFSDALNEQAGMAAHRKGVEQEVREAFALAGVIPSERIALPSVNYAKERESAVTLRAAVLEMVQEGHVDDELMALVEKGSCALADALRQALRDKYIERHADEVAEMRS